MATVNNAALVVYEKGLHGAVDKAGQSEAGDRGLDVSSAAGLDLLFQPTVGAPDPVAGETPPRGTTDPHFWLDPQRYSDVAKANAD